jgi:uncharacterized protein (DUF2132 family)
MKRQQPNNPLHGVKLADILEFLVSRYGWEEMGKRINIKCFTQDPSIKSSLKFLRKTPWARTKVEQLFILGMWIPVKFIQDFKIPLRIGFEKNQEGILMKKIIIWIKLNWIKLLVAIISGIITYELLDWIYIQNL